MKKNSIYTKKQVGVIYRAIKQGELTAERETINYLYDHVGDRARKGEAEDVILGVQFIVDYIFDGKLEYAQRDLDSIADNMALSSIAWRW